MDIPLSSYIVRYMKMEVKVPVLNNIENVNWTALVDFAAHFTVVLVCTPLYIIILLPFVISALVVVLIVSRL